MTLPPPFSSGGLLSFLFLHFLLFMPSIATLSLPFFYDGFEKSLNLVGRRMPEAELRRERGREGPGSPHLAPKRDSQIDIWPSNEAAVARGAQQQQQEHEDGCNFKSEEMRGSRSSHLDPSLLPRLYLLQPCLLVALSSSSSALVSFLSLLVVG